MIRALTFISTFLVATTFLVLPQVNAQTTGASATMKNYSRFVGGVNTNVYTAGADVLTGNFQIEGLGGPYGCTVDWTWTITSSAGAGSFQISDVGSFSVAASATKTEDDSFPAVSVQTPMPDYYEVKIEVTVEYDDFWGNPQSDTTIYKRYFYKTGTTPPPNQN